MKVFYRTLSIITFLIISTLAITMTSNYVLEKEKELLEKKYSDIHNNINQKVNSLISKKKNATLALTITLANNKKVVDILKNKEGETLKNISLLLREETEFKNVWFQVISKEGISLYRSWSDKKNDAIYKVRSDLIEMLKAPKIKSTISVGRYDMTFKAMVPIYENKKFIGIIETITHFNSISRSLRKSDNLEPIIIVNKKYSKQLKKNAFTKIFLKGHYIANLSVSKDLITYLESKDINKLIDSKKYLVQDGFLIINTEVAFKNKMLASFISFKKLDEIDISDINEYKDNAFLYLGIFIILLGLLLFIISYYLYSQKLNKLYQQLNENQNQLNQLNNSLQQSVDEEVAKNYEKNKMLFQQNKMAAMGEMIENIAHQWRQPLSVITTATSGLKLKKELDDLNDKEYYESLEVIMTSAGYLSNTIDDFRYFFSPDRSKNIFNSTQIIRKVLNLIKNEYESKDIKIIENVKDFDIYTYENELLQVILNLLNNAKDELVKVEDIENRYIFIDLYKEDEEVFLKIKDNAGGIDEKIKDRIFEPYFTTKHKSQGTGIGLYMSEEIVVKHMEGSLKAENKSFIYKNNEYQGALFTLHISK